MKAICNEFEKIMKAICNEFEKITILLMVLLVFGLVFQGCKPKSYEEARAGYDVIKAECLAMYDMMDPVTQAYYKSKYWQYFRDAEMALDTWQTLIELGEDETAQKAIYLKIRKILLRIVIKELAKEAAKKHQQS